MVTTQACLERVMKVLKEDGETPPNWLEYSLLCRYDVSAYLALKGENNPVKQSLCRRTRNFDYYSTKVLEYKAGRDKAKDKILEGRPTLLFLSVAFLHI